MSVHVCKELVLSFNPFFQNLKGAYIFLKGFSLKLTCTHQKFEYLSSKCDKILTPLHCVLSLRSTMRFYFVGINLISIKSLNTTGFVERLINLCLKRFHRFLVSFQTKETVERSHGEPIKFLFLPKMGLLGSQASNE